MFWGYREILVFVALNVSSLSSFNHIYLALIENSGSFWLHIVLLIRQGQDALDWIVALIQWHVVMQIFLVKTNGLYVILIYWNIIEILKHRIFVVNLRFRKRWIFSSCLSWYWLIILVYILILLYVDDLIVSWKRNEFSILLNKVLVWRKFAVFLELLWGLDYRHVLASFLFNQLLRLLKSAYSLIWDFF